MKKHYQLIALDMDGTLLSSDKQITPRTREAIARAAAQGKEVVMCTGRSTREVMEYFDAVPGIRYAICNSGAYIYDHQRDEILFPQPLEWSVLRDLVDIMGKRDVLPQVFVDGTPYFSREKIENIRNYRIEYYKELFLKTGILCDDSLAYALDPANSIFKICLYHRSEEERSESLELVRHLPLEFAFAEATSLEVSPKGIDKGTVLVKLCRMLNIPVEETIGVGDSFNDLPMLHTAGLPVAMGNARDAIKAVCAAEVADCDHDGVAEAIERFLL